MNNRKLRLNKMFKLALRVVLKNFKKQPKKKDCSYFLQNFSPTIFVEKVHMQKFIDYRGQYLNYNQNLDQLL